ncbi:MAG: hypothetical protein EDX89_05225 [Acidobacteria bacterium]|nr:MAG: hypothetical protein EDX89_05225 [Acidobacteriota bacterium]MCE7957126.1 hypothetical protein [Acidobacteria bacterium ACB2]
MDALLAAEAVTPRWCDVHRCVVPADSEAILSRLRSLEARGLVRLEELRDARKLFFANAVWDADLRSFDRVFPGRTELDPENPNGLFCLVLKSYAGQAWIEEMEAAGLVPIDALFDMGYLVYGGRTAAEAFASGRPWVYRLLELPAGLKRIGLPEGAIPPGTPPTAHVVAVVDKPGLPAKARLEAIATARGTRLIESYRASNLVAYSVPLLTAEAREMSRMADVFSVSRAGEGEPADERSNRIVSGLYQQPGTSWPAVASGSYPTQFPPFPDNPVGGPYHWDQYLASLNLGTQLANQVVGILDTGIYDGLKTSSGADTCPPFLRETPTSECRLFFTTDITTSFTTHKEANDNSNHGTVVASLLAGYASSESPHRDAGRFSFAQGVAPGSRIALSRMLARCQSDPPNYYSYLPDGEPLTEELTKSLRYSYVELTSTATLPERSGNPAARVFNLSLSDNDAGRDYDTSAILLDQVTRRADAACFEFQTPYGRKCGATMTATTNVIAAGNCFDEPTCGVVLTPGVAKNVITVGATETWSPFDCTPNGCYVDLGRNNVPRVVAAYSRIGYPYDRLKPDLVAPGQRAYGIRSQPTGPTPCDQCVLPLGPNEFDFVDLDSCPEVGAPGLGQYIWESGTSFATPIVTGVATLSRAWLARDFGRTDPSPALVKALLIATAKNLVASRTGLPGDPNRLCCDQPNGTGTCWPCRDMKPAPDQLQGWGGVALDRLFLPTTNYYLLDQAYVFNDAMGTPPWVKVVYPNDRSRQLSVALVWTDKFSHMLSGVWQNLMNDLDLSIEALDVSGATLWSYYGNRYYDDRESPSRDGFSLTIPPAAVVYDRKNNVERIDIRASELTNVASLRITVTPFVLRAGHLCIVESPCRTGTQDFALVVENGRENP